LSFSLSGINYRKNERDILSDITIELTEDSIGILGPNGSGKTTLIKIIGGLIKPTNGQVIFNGQNLNIISDLDRAKNIGYVQQDRENVLGFTLYEYVELGTFPHKNTLDFRYKDSSDSINESLEIAGLIDRKHELVNNLSGGEMQVLRIARVLCQKTDVILFDEPTSNLDIKNAHLVCLLINKLNTNGIQTIVTSHDFRVLKNISKYACLLKHGKIAGYGLVDDILTQENITDAFELSYEQLLEMTSKQFQHLQ